MSTSSSPFALSAAAPSSSAALSLKTTRWASTSFESASSFAVSGAFSSATSFVAASGSNSSGGAASTLGSSSKTLAARAGASTSSGICRLPNSARSRPPVLLFRTRRPRRSARIWSMSSFPLLALSSGMERFSKAAAKLPLATSRCCSFFSLLSNSSPKAACTRTSRASTRNLSSAAESRRPGRISESLSALFKFMLNMQSKSSSPLVSLADFLSVGISSFFASTDGFFSSEQVTSSPFASSGCLSSSATSFGVAHIASAPANHLATCGGGAASTLGSSAKAFSAAAGASFSTSGGGASFSLAASSAGASRPLCK
mmetsp:Transcript_12986/g.46097  ORF Transcript_12986/g.46097 Transcript_12986/m.46097 type:complete len:315 (+) Transcript_12986:557-1501(+)